MITENEIMEIMCEYYDFKKDVWCKHLYITIDGFAKIAKTIVDKNEEEGKEPIDYMSDKPVKLIKGYQKPNKESEEKK